MPHTRDGCREARGEPARAPDSARAAAESGEAPAPPSRRGSLLGCSANSSSHLRVTQRFLSALRPPKRGLSRQYWHRPQSSRAHPSHSHRARLGGAPCAEPCAEPCAARGEARGAGSDEAAAAARAVLSAATPAPFSVCVMARELLRAGCHASAQSPP